MAKLSYLDVWQRDDSRAETDAIDLWRNLGALPSSETVEERKKSLCIVAYAGSELVGVSTVKLRTMEMVKCRVGFFRCLVGPGHRQQGLATEFTVRCFKRLGAWSRDNPAEGLMGMATIVQSQSLSEKSRDPVWPLTGLTLIGYTPRNDQIRLAWFKHARL